MRQIGQIEMSLDTLNFGLPPKHRFASYKNSVVRPTQLDARKPGSNAGRAKIV